MNISRALGIIIAILGIYLLLTYKQEPALVSVLPQEYENANQELVAEIDTESIPNTTTEPADEITAPRIPDRSICVGEYCDGHMKGDDNYTLVKIPLITNGGTLGCGSKLIMSPHVVEPKTSRVLDASYRTLFSVKAESDILEDGIRNPVGNLHELSYQKVSLTKGTAQVYLVGSYIIPGTCAIPEFRAQIEQIALQYTSVDELRVHLNGNMWDWCDYSMAEPSEDGCDKNPKYWITSK